MDKIKIGIPRGIHYYYFGNFWKYFFEKCNIELIYSPKTTQELVDRGSAIAPDEMCLSMKIYLGHLSYLEGKCDYVLIPRIDRFDKNNQTCTNFLAIYDLAHHYFQTPILNYNIDTHHDLLDGLLELRDLLGISKMELIKAYEYAKEKERQIKEQQEKEQYQKMSEDGKKVLVVSHAYNIHDDFIGGPLEKLLEDNHIIPLYSDYFQEEQTNALARCLSKDLYWKYSRDAIGAIPLCEKVDGIIFLSTFPCGLDSLVYEFVMRSMEKPYLYLVMDDLSSKTGLETRIESFVDLLEQS